MQLLAYSILINLALNLMNSRPNIIWSKKEAHNEFLKKYDAMLALKAFLFINFAA